MFSQIMYFAINKTLKNVRPFPEDSTCYYSYFFVFCYSYQKDERGNPETYYKGDTNSAPHPRKLKLQRAKYTKVSKCCGKQIIP